MNRWLIYYTPMATVVRLFTIESLIGFITNKAVKYIGLNDPRMFLPAWIFVALVSPLSAARARGRMQLMVYRRH